MEKKITVEKFVNEYMSSDKKNEYMSKVVYRTYAPLMEKRIVLDSFISKSVKNINDLCVIDYVDVDVFFVCAVLLLYTNIEVNKSVDIRNNLYADYDLLINNELLDVIYEKIGKKEIDELTKIRDLLLLSITKRIDSSINTCKYIWKKAVEFTSTKMSEIQRLIESVDVEQIKSQINDFVKK